MPTAPARVSTACLALALVLLLPWARPAAADEADDEQRAAAAIGRDLLATDDAVRERAIQRLLARIERGGDMGPFLQAMGRATKDWADRRERLLDVWIGKAVHGSAREREQASRLIHALGPKAVERLLDELRHARGMQTEATPAPSAPTARPVPAQRVSEPQNDAEVPTAAEAPACCTPRIYNVLDLGKRGMNAVELRSMLQKIPDAIEVKDIGRGIYVVTASLAGHASLDEALQRIRTRVSKADQQADATKATGPRWQLTPVLYRVPREVVVRPRGQYAVPTKQRAGGLPQASDPDSTEVHVGSGMDAALWMKHLQSGPNGVRASRASGTTTLVAGQEGSFAQRRETRYRKGLVRSKDGSWNIEHGTLTLGIEFDVTIQPRGEQLEVRLTAARSEVAMPMLVDEIRPDPNRAGYELDRPEWIITKAHSLFRVPATGGAAFVSLGDLGSTEKEHVILILRIAPVVQQKGVR